MKKTMIIGTIISAIFVYLSVKNVDFRQIVNSFKNADIKFVIITLLILLLLQFLKSYRWGVILSPLEKINQLTLFSVTSVGFFMVLAIPSRVGEFAKPFLISRKSDIRLTSAIASIFVERVLDSIALLLMFILVLSNIELPKWLVNTGVIFFTIVLSILVCMIFLALNRTYASIFMDFFLKWFPEKISDIIKSLFDHFVDGFKMLANIKLIFFVSLLSLIIWVIEAFCAYSMFYVLNFKLPLIAGFALIVILALGLVVPTAPGFVGNWHLFCVVALALFNISKTDGMTFAILFHFLYVGITVFLGLIFLPSNKFSFSDLRNGL
tara:strand:+ start:1195 stop:2163 length:969 start_codon:yes stop_codon:yes gene_type:complete